MFHRVDEPVPALVPGTLCRQRVVPVCRGLLLWFRLYRGVRHSPDTSTLLAEPRN